MHIQNINYFQINKKLLPAQNESYFAVGIELQLTYLNLRPYRSNIAHFPHSTIDLSDKLAVKFVFYVKA